MTLVLHEVHTKLGDRSFTFNLSAEVGEIHAILGKSGSGKSTLLNLVGGFITPLSGAITWQGNSLLPLKPEQRPLTTLFQSHNLFDHLSVRHNIALGISPKMKLDTTQWKEVDRVLEDVGLPSKADARPERLSGGEQQRVGLARCLVRKRPVLLLDEPYGALDEATRVEMLSLTQKVIAENNLCVLMVTHNKDDAVYLSATKHEVIDGVLAN